MSAATVSSPATSSEDLARLESEFRTHLEQLADDEESADGHGHRRYLRRLLVHVWKATSKGAFDAVRDAVDILRHVRLAVDDALPELTARETAAIEIQQALAVLYLGEEALREVRLDLRLSSRGQHPTERAVLEALVADDRYRPRSEIHRDVDLGGGKQPTRQRVGQILAELHEHGYLLRRNETAQGSRKAAHYALSPRGWALCERLGLAVEPVSRPARSRAGTSKEASKRLAVVPEAVAAATAQALSSGDWAKVRIIQGLYEGSSSLLLANDALNEATLWIEHASGQGGDAGSERVAETRRQLRAAERTCREVVMAGA